MPDAGTDSNTPSRPADRWALPALFLGAAGISFAPIFVRLSETGPTATAFWRIALSLPILAVLMMRRPDAERRVSRLSGRPWAGLIATGLFFAADLGVWHWSIHFTTVANATLFANFAPIFVTLAAFFLFGERFSKFFYGGLAGATLGAATLIGASLSMSPRTLFGDMLGLATAVFYAGYLMTVSRLRARVSTLALMFWSGLVSSLALLLAALATGEAMIPVSARGWAVLVALALISQVLGQTLIAYALVHLSAAFGSVNLMLQPVLSIVLAWGLLSESLGPRQILGALIVLTGLFLAHRGRVQKRIGGPTGRSGARRSPLP